MSACTYSSQRRKNILSGFTVLIHGKSLRLQHARSRFFARHGFGLQQKESFQCQLRYKAEKENTNSATYT